MKTYSPEIGIGLPSPASACETRRARAVLHERLYVIDGLRFATEDEIWRYNCIPQDFGRVIVPAIPPEGIRHATRGELNAIIATEDTKRVMQLLKPPKNVFSELFNGCARKKQLANGAYEMQKTIDESRPYTEIAPGIVGQYLKVRHDRENQPIVTEIDGGKQYLGMKVGFHIDAYEDSERVLGIGNAGEDSRLHGFVPDFDRDKAGGAGRKVRAEYLEKHLTERPYYPLKVYCVEVRPGEILTSFVSRYMHEGLSYGYEQATMFSFAVDPKQSDLARYELAC